MPNCRGSRPASLSSPLTVAMRLRASRAAATAWEQDFLPLINAERGSTPTGVVILDDVLPRSVASFKAFENAMSLDIAMGGSTNTVLHLLAAAYEAGVDFTRHSGRAALNLEFRGKRGLRPVPDGRQHLAGLVVVIVDGLLAEQYEIG